MASERLWRRYAAGFALSFALSVTPHARAQGEVDSETRSIARELALQGAEAYEQKDYTTALDRFQRAATLFRAPSIVVMLARTLVQTGRFLEALDRYEETQRSPLPPDAPEAFRLAVEDARSEARALRARLPRLEVRTGAGAPRDGLSIKLDGRSVSDALLDVERPIDPGSHQLVVSAAGRVPFHEDFSMTEGERRVITLPALAPLEVDRSSASMAARTAPSERTRTWALALGGVGLGALGVGVASGIVALGHKSELDSECRPGCPSSARDELSSYRTNRTISYVSLGLGTAALGTGAYLWFLSSKGHASVTARVAPGAISLTGAF
ncbi:MAG TPA: hypothetical protein VFQ35_20260 [Polyangiaceae bacterium]|nr:hypothetical protein [Polyangiaceae bacterium]